MAVSKQRFFNARLQRNLPKISDQRSKTPQQEIDWRFNRVNNKKANQNADNQTFHGEEIEDDNRSSMYKN